MKIKYYQLARRMSRFSNHRHHKLGAVLVAKNKVINTGFNSTSTHPKSPDRKWFSVHAEFSALLGIEAYKVRGSDLYVTRSTITMPYANSKPCEECEFFIRKMGIRRVHYINQERQFASMKIN